MEIKKKEVRVTITKIALMGKKKLVFLILVNIMCHFE